MCPKEYQFRHVRRIHTPQVVTPEYFTVGAMFHAGRARWFAERFKLNESVWASIYEAVQEVALENKLPVKKEAEQKAMKLLTAYTAHYRTQPLPDPIAAEYKLGPTPLLPGDPFPLWRTARLDDVSRYPEAGGRLCIGESKTTSNPSPNDTIEQYTLHGQTMLQALLWKNDPNGEKKYGPIEGILLDVTCKTYREGETPKFGRAFIPITDHQLGWFAKTLGGYLRASAGIDRNSDAPRNVSSCTRLTGRARVACEFRDLCRFGSSAAARFVIENGLSLKEWAKQHPSEVAPWL